MFSIRMEHKKDYTKNISADKTVDISADQTEDYTKNISADKTVDISADISVVTKDVSTDII